MLTPLRIFIGEDSGATAVEYGLIIALVALVAMTAVQMFGRSVSALFNVPPPSSLGPGF